MEFKFTNVKKELVSFLEDVIESNNCTITQKWFQSKYNSYVRYDYEPFCTDGFDIEITIQGNAHFVAYVDYLYRKRCFDIEHLNRCAKIEYKPSILEKIGIGKK